MVDQKFVCVAIILLIASCVNSLPQPNSEAASPAVVAKSSNSSYVRPSMKNVINVPNNCPEGEKMGVDGVCREVFD